MRWPRCWAGLLWLCACTGSHTGPAAAADAAVAHDDLAHGDLAEADSDAAAAADTGAPGDVAQADLADSVSLTDAAPPDTQDSAADQPGCDCQDASAAGPDVDAADGADAAVDASPTQSWPGVCPPDPLPPGIATKKLGFLPPGLGCAKPGWPSAAAAVPPVWSNVTAAVGLDQLGWLDTCLLWQDLTGDGSADLLVIEQPGSPAAKRYARLYQQTGGKWLATKVELPASVLVPDCAPIDWDGDGDLDVALGTTGGLRLLKFGPSGMVDDTAASVPAFAKGVMAWSPVPIDLDRDGDQDLYLARTAQMNLAPGNYQCHAADAPHLQCCYGPAPADEACLVKTAATPMETWSCCPAYDLEAGNLLLRHDGAQFVDVTAASKASDPGASLAVAPYDYDRDGWTDLFVGNDFAPMHWYRAGGDGSFVALGKEIGLRPYGHIMGVGLADFDLDGHVDLTTADVGPVSLYRGSVAGTFVDSSAAMGVQAATVDVVSWGQLAADLDNDGWPDLLSLHSMQAKPGQLVAAIAASQPGPLTVPGHHVLFHNTGGKLLATSLDWLPTTETTITPVSAAVADYDGDGDLDLVHMTPPGLLTVLRNDSAKRHWLGVLLVNKAGAYGGLGAKIQVWAKGYAQEHEVQFAPATFAHGDAAGHFGLGDVATLDHVVVWWPSGCVTTVDGVAADQLLTVSEVSAVCPAP